MNSIPCAALALAVLSVATPAPSARPSLLHDDDPKVLDRKAPYRGQGFRSGAIRQADGSLALDSPPSIFTKSGLSLFAWLPVEVFGNHQGANDCWGYVSPSGREYVLLGLTRAVAFVEITSPGNPELVAVMDEKASLWRDIKVYDHYAYSVTEGGDGIQIYDLDQIDAGVVIHVGAVSGPDTGKTHNVAINETSGFLYRCGGADNGLRIYSLADPESPSWVGSWTDRYVHDAQIVTYDQGPYAGREIAFCCTGFDGGFVQPGLHILDVTDKQNIIELAYLSYSVAAYSHQAWLSEDRQYLYLNDESDEQAWGQTATHIIDVSDLSNPSDVGVFLGTNAAVGHNLYTSGDLIFEANYTSGLRIYDASDPVQLQEVAYYDTWHTDDEPTFNGLWSVYPYFPSGTVVGSDIDKGLFVWGIGDPPVQFEHPDGLPAPVDPDGQRITTLVTETSDGDLVPSSVTLHYEIGGTETAAPMQDVGGGVYEAFLPALACGTPVRYFVSAESQNGVVWRSPEGAPAAAVVTTVATGETILFEDDFQTKTGLWGKWEHDTKSQGGWIRAAPTPTDAQPGTDVTLDGTKCMFTGEAWSSAPIGQNDVDGGISSIMFDPFDLSGTTEVMIDYWRWFSNDQGAGTPDDTFRVFVTNDGDNWVEVESIGPGHPEASGGWYFHSFRLRDFVEPSATVQVRFSAEDQGAESIVEAAMDDFKIREVLCGDCNANGISDEYEVEQGLVADLNGDGAPDECDALSADTLEISLSAGGIQSFQLAAGEEFGGQLYWMLGSLSGTEPGLPIGTLTLPLNSDDYFQLTLVAPNAPPLAASLGTLDGAGEAQASFSVAPAANPAFAGLVFHHAFFAADSVTEQLTAVSNAVELTLLP